jgi:excinuclease ABC subunit C
MIVPEPIRLDAAADLSPVPDAGAVFLLWAREGAPHLAKTALLRRRLRRLLGDSRWSSLKGVIERIDYWPTANSLSTALTFYALNRLHFPEDYLTRTRLRMPPYLKLATNNAFPRTLVTSRLSHGHFFGPFRSRAAAEEFEKQSLDFFQIRRCQEDLAPAPDHPGCIYGEMNMCLRPCQEVVGEEEYSTEVARVREFLNTRGESLAATIERARHRASDDLDFEEAARQHKRLEKVQALLRSLDEPVTELGQMNGVAVGKSASAGEVELRFLLGGVWQEPRTFAIEGAGQSMDARLRAVVAEVSPARATIAERQEHLALLARWLYSTWRDGEWLQFTSLETIPYRKLVRAISRVALGEQQTLF